FSQENIVDFSIDTFSTGLVSDALDPFEDEALLGGSIADEQSKGDITIVIRKEKANAYSRFMINRVTVYPDFISADDARDTTMFQTKVGETVFRYHKEYIKAQVIQKHIYLEPGKIY